MKQYSSKYIIIGAGLSGLTTAYKLYQSGENDFIVLESRKQLGGRITTKNGVDFGATWFQTYHQNVFALCKELDISVFNQYNKGKSILTYNTMAPPHYFENDTESPSAHRIAGGSITLIDKLAASIADKIQFNTTVSTVKNLGECITVATEASIYTAEKLIITLPPLLASGMSFSPELPFELLQLMRTTHTWMSNALKVGITFKTPFWRTKGLSGTVLGQASPVSELYDHSDSKDEQFALMGFLNEGMRKASEKERKSIVLNYLSKHLGEEIWDHTSYEEKDWSVDRHTAYQDATNDYRSPHYGNKLFQESYMGGKLFFSGAETSPVNGGYMDGAIFSGIAASKRIVS